MKRIKAMNGYAIYQLTERDINGDFPNATAGNYNVYFSADIRDYGVKYSTPEYDDIETLEAACDYCRNFTGLAMNAVSDAYTCVDFDDVEAVAAKLESEYSAPESVTPDDANDALQAVEATESEYDIYRDMMQEKSELETAIRERLTNDGYTVYGVFLSVAVESERLYFADIEYSKNGDYNRIYRRMDKDALLKYFHISNPCATCKYSDACGDPERLKPCNGYARK